MTLTPLVVVEDSAVNARDLRVQGDAAREFLQERRPEKSALDHSSSTLVVLMMPLSSVGALLRRGHFRFDLAPNHAGPR